jgi:hypothetical protein
MYETSAKKKVHSQTMEHKIERERQSRFQLRNPPIFCWVRAPQVGRCLSTPSSSGPRQLFPPAARTISTITIGLALFLVLCYMPTCRSRWRVCASAYVPGRRSSRAPKREEKFRNISVGFSSSGTWATTLHPLVVLGVGSLPPFLGKIHFQNAGIPKRPVGPIFSFFSATTNFPRRMHNS